MPKCTKSFKSKLLLLKHFENSHHSKGVIQSIDQSKPADKQESKERKKKIYGGIKLNTEIFYEKMNYVQKNYYDRFIKKLE